MSTVTKKELMGQVADATKTKRSAVKQAVHPPPRLIGTILAQSTVPMKNALANP